MSKKSSDVTFEAPMSTPIKIRQRERRIS